MFEKVDVNGEDRHPVYEILTATDGDDGHSGDVRWNFEKFLVTPDGSVRRFAPQVTPDDPVLVAAIEAALFRTRPPCGAGARRSARSRSRSRTAPPRGW